LGQPWGTVLKERFCGLVGQLSQLSEDERYDAEDYYAQCRRRARKVGVADENEEEEAEEEQVVDD